MSKLFSKNSESCHSTESPVIEKENTFPVVALVGVPNSGKTTLFNALTGSNFKTSNYPGATVEYSAGKLISKIGFNAWVIDTPGIISLNPSSPDEEVTINGLFNHHKYGIPDLIIVTADCTQLSRQLFLVKQILDSGLNAIVALTMNDILDRKGLEVDVEKLSSILRCPVIKVESRKRIGITELGNKAKEIYDLSQILSGKEKSKRPGHPDEVSIAKLYDFTETTERAVLKTKKGNIDIDAINEKVFKNIHRKPDNNSLKLDRIFLHPLWGMVIFFISMGLIFTSIFWLARPIMNLIDSGFGSLSDLVSVILPQNTWYNDLITKGFIKGFGSVMIFLPQIIILFIYLGLLEDSGYLARAAMIIDKPLSKFGLNGRSFVPMLSGYACAIPAIMAARTIPNRRERYLTIMIIPLMSCSARVPVYALLLAFLVPPDKPWLAGIGLGALYLFSLISGSVVAAVISKFKKSDEKSTFMLELPAYRKPVIKHIFRNTWHKASVYVKQAGPIIVLISLILWALTYFPDIHPDLSKEKTQGMSEKQIEQLTESLRLNHSYAAMLGNVFQPALKPLGWDWRIGVSLISAFAAREVFVSSMAITFSITGDTDDDENMQNSILTSMKEAKQFGTDKPLFTAASIIALIIYFMFAMQCLSTIAVVRKETGSWRIPVLQLVVYTIMAYVLAFITYNGLRLVGIS